MKHTGYTILNQNLETGIILAATLVYSALPKYLIKTRKNGIVYNYKYCYICFEPIATEVFSKSKLSRLIRLSQLKLRSRS